MIFSLIWVPLLLLSACGDAVCDKGQSIIDDCYSNGTSAKKFDIADCRTALKSCTPSDTTSIVSALSCFQRNTSCSDGAVESTTYTTNCQLPSSTSQTCSYNLYNAGLPIVIPTPTPTSGG